jgi:circadian clock protein KaiB
MTFDPSNGTIRLFIAANAPNSRIALDNLSRLMAEAGISRESLQVIDVIENPEAALDNGIFITPALLLGSGGSSVLVYGNLTHTRELESILGLNRQTNA